MWIHLWPALEMNTYLLIQMLARQQLKLDHCSNSFGLHTNGKIGEKVHSKIVKAGLFSFLIYTKMFIVQNGSFQFLQLDENVWKYDSHLASFTAFATIQEVSLSRTFRVGWSFKWKGTFKGTHKKRKRKEKYPGIKLAFKGKLIKWNYINKQRHHPGTLYLFVL